MIQFADIVVESVVDGPGIRLVVFLQGCPRHCPACHNEDLISADGGRSISMHEEDLAELILGKLTPLHAGITFSGGDPFMQVQALTKVVQILKGKIPELNIWAYTGYLYEEVQQLPVMSFLNVLVDGPFMINRKRLNLAFRGSDNQRIIAVQESFQKGKIVELHLEQMPIAG